MAADLPTYENPIESPTALTGSFRREGDPASTMPVTPDVEPKDDREPLWDWSQRRIEERGILQEKIDQGHWQRNEKIREVPEPDFWSGNEMVDATRAQGIIPDYSHLTVPDYSHLAPEEDNPADRESPAPDLLKFAKDAITGAYEDIKKFSENPTPENAFKIAIQIVGGGVAAGPERGALGITGGKPPYFRKPANDNSKGMEPGGTLPQPDPFMINTVTESPMTQAAITQRVQQLNQRLRQETIASGRTRFEGSRIAELEATAHQMREDIKHGMFSSDAMAIMDKEIAAIDEMIIEMKAKNPGSVVPIDKLEMKRDPIFANLMSQEYRKALVSGDLSSQYDILGGKLINDKKLTPAQRAGIEQERKRLLEEMGPEGRKAIGITTETIPQEPQARHYAIKGMQLSHDDKEIIRELNDRGKDAFQIAKAMSAVRVARKTPNPEISEDKIKRYIKSMGLITPETRREVAIRAEVVAQDIELLGKGRSQEEVYQAVKEKFPGVQKSAIDNVLDRVRAQKRNDRMTAEKYGVELNPAKEMAQQQKSGESIFKPVGQGEFDFHQIEKVIHPIPTTEEAKREMIFASSIYAKFKGSILDLNTASANTLEEMRLRSVLAARAKDLHATVSQMEKDAKNGDLLGKHAREYMQGRIQHLQDTIIDIKDKLWGEQAKTRSVSEAEINRSIAQEAPNELIEKGGKQGKLVDRGRSSDPFSAGAAVTPRELVHYRESPSAIPREGIERSGRNSPNKGPGYQMGMTVGGIKLGQRQVQLMEEMAVNGDTAADIVRKMKSRHGINLKQAAVEAALQRRLRDKIVNPQDL